MAVFQEDNLNRFSEAGQSYQQKSTTDKI